ncbi:MAG: hypothetical protein IJU24_08610 [Bacteroidaceae bacterium]|nr:hypothetical protein [Bacteroidaceae bacterium]MBR4593786.1 hypothetical protein [Bacteroidaceae bacterium]
MDLEPSLHSSLHTPAHRACPTYILRTIISIRRSGRLRGFTAAPAQALTE